MTSDARTATCLVHATVQRKATPGHIRVAAVRPIHGRRKTVHQKPTTVTRFAKRSVKQLGSAVGSRAWKPAMRSGLGLTLMGLLASARQQIAQGSQGNPEAVDDKEMTL